MTDIQVELSNFDIQFQKKFQWCWAAVGASCAAAYDPENKWDQSSIVRACSIAYDSPKFPKICDMDPDFYKCDVIHFLESKSHTYGSFITIGIANKYKETPIEFDDIKSQIDEGLLVGVRVKHKALSIAHFLVINGYSIYKNVKYLRVHDPAGDSYRDYEFDDFLLNYGDQYYVTTIFFTKPLIKPLEIRINHSPTTIPFKRFIDRIFNGSFYKKNKFEKDNSVIIYESNLEDIVNDGNLEKAYSIGVRYFQFGKNNKVFFYEKFYDEKEHELNRASIGKNVDEQKQVIDQIRNSDNISGFEIAYLRIEVLKIKAIWLRSYNRNNQDSDIYIPLKPCFYGFESAQRYPSSEFLSKLVNAAKIFEEQILSQNDDDDFD